MEQKSDVEYRAEKLYKNSREKFGYLIREVVSNAIHAAIIRDKNENHPQYQPQVEVIIDKDEDHVEIVVKDNGEGFTDINRKYFTHLDTRNPQKEILHFHPMGQGRLAIVYFSDNASYRSVYRQENGEYRQKHFNYPEISCPLFDIEVSDGSKTDKENSETVLTLKLIKQHTYKRANTFFSKYSDIEKIKNWFIENFFPFFIENERLQVSVELTGQMVNVTRSYIEKNVDSIPFKVKFENESDAQSEFKLWLLKKEDTPKTRNQIICFARHLRAEIEEGRIEYEIDLPDAYDWFLSSEYFDDNVDQKGDKIEIPVEHVEKIQFSLAAVLDQHFASQIERNRSETRKNVATTKEKYLSLSVFIDEKKAASTNSVLREADLVSTAIESKGKVEKSYWINQESETEEIGKLLNSSLQIYVDHRKRVLQKFQGLIRKFDEEGEIKNELEDDIHDLFLKRGENLRTSANKNHLHNLWILDDKYTIFSETFKGLSTRKGQEASDIYLWSDDPKLPRELLILELKSTSSAHNAGSKYESMVAQVKRYAAQFYKEPVKVLNWDADPDKILYFGVILARKSDINKELNSNNIGGSPHKIPFLDSSYFFNENFSIGANSAAAPQFREIRIEMYAYEDIYRLASSRNDVFFRLLKGEYSLEDEK
ncbi:MAG: hypothetical protein A2511_09685 [Deltaproteobacteria bacterium RIFOXYD12_FULL_50_9]|nr:MAG: hypothetical protein A2511_09685 [Deltaproteobacteria bacterium RIFOXYD12_FULL_50_9]